MEMQKKRKIISLYSVDDSEDEEIIQILTKPVQLPRSVLLDDDNDDDEVQIAGLSEVIMKYVHRDERVKTRNYILDTVHLYNDMDFLMHFRLRRELVNDLVGRFSASHMYTSLLSNTAGKPPLGAEEHMLAFLWFVGHKSSYRDVADRFHITLSSLHAVISRVTEFILSIASEVIRLPTPEERVATVQHFLIQKKFPRVVGAIDGTHIKINRPKNDQESYYTRKKEHAIHVQGIVDHNKKFLDVFVGYPGSVHDARVFKNSDIYPMLSDLCPGDHFILGDSAYPLSKKVIVPYRDNGHLTAKQKYFNKTLSSCRVKVEHAFGALKQRFRHLYHCELRNLQRIVKLIYACCVLHNIADFEDLTAFEPPLQAPAHDDYDDEDPPPPIEITERYHNEACRYRNELCDTVWNLRN